MLTFPASLSIGYYMPAVNYVRLASRSAWGRRLHEAVELSTHGFEPLSQPPVVFGTICTAQKCHLSVPSISCISSNCFSRCVKQFSKSRRIEPFLWNRFILIAPHFGYPNGVCDSDGREWMLQII